MTSLLRLGFFVALCTAAAQTPVFSDSQRGAKLASAFAQADLLMERFHKERGTPGLIYGIVIDGKLAHVRSWGMRDIDARALVTHDTVFRIASMTKSFTALAVLKLRDEGKLSLEDPVAKWIPEFASMAMPTRDAAPIRVRHLLTHTAGFPEDNPWGDRQLGESEATLDRWLRAGIPFSTSPGTAFEYSNYGFALAGRIIERASGVPYRTYVEEQILAPLGLKASTLEPSAVPAATRAQGYRKNPAGGYQPEESLPHGVFGAMGGLLTSAPDLARYIAFHLNAWPPRDEADPGPVKRSSVRELHAMSVHSDLTATTSPQLRATSAGYGFGVRVLQDCRFRHIVGHGGGLPGFGSYMTWLPEYGVGLFAMTNLTYAGPSEPLNGVYDALLRTGRLTPRQLPPSPVLTRTRDAIFDLWRTRDEEKGKRLAAGNLLLDEPLASRFSAMQQIASRVGACKSASNVDPQNLLRGSFRLDCERGNVYVTFTLAPTEPVAVQHLAFSETAPQGDKACRP